MQITIEKQPYERAVKKSISMPRILLDEAQMRQREHRLATLSDYFQQLVREDVDRKKRPA